MYIKFFKNKKGGSVNATKYLLNNRVKNGTAKILKGDRKLTDDIIKSISNKQKVSVGVLSFEEQSLTAAQKEELMLEFEKTLFPEMSEDEYNILWVEHTDKNRLELNFVIPKIHLPSKKSFNPYFHSVDFPRIEMFEDVYNTKFSLSSKKDPRKQQSLDNTKNERNKKAFGDYKNIHKQLIEMVGKGELKSRDDILKILKKNNIEIPRVGKNYISIKMPGEKKSRRLKGLIYSETFTEGELNNILNSKDEEFIEYKNRDIQKEYLNNMRRLEEYNLQKALNIRNKYPLKEPSISSQTDSLQKENKQDERKLNDFRTRADERARERERVFGVLEKRNIPERSRVSESVEKHRARSIQEARRTMQERNRRRKRERQYSRTVGQISQVINELVSGFEREISEFRDATERITARIRELKIKRDNRIIINRGTPDEGDGGFKVKI